MLIQPRSAKQFHRIPKLNINDSEPVEFFLCEDSDCDRCKSSVLVLDLLKSSLLSKTPLTDLFLGKKENQEDYELPYDSFSSDFDIGKVSAQTLAPAEDSKHMKVKVMVKKSESKLLFAQAEEDFADFLLSFLTLPLGAVLNLLQGNSGSICSDNLFKSLADLHGDKHLKSEEIKNMLIKPQIASQFRVQNQILPVDEAIAPNYSF